jgi:hypothetical protein
MLQKQTNKKKLEGAGAPEDFIRSPPSGLLYEENCSPILLKHCYFGLLLVAKTVT